MGGLYIPPVTILQSHHALSSFVILQALLSVKFWICGQIKEKKEKPLLELCESQSIGNANTMQCYTPANVAHLYNKSNQGENKEGI